MKPEPCKYYVDIRYRPFNPGSDLCLKIKAKPGRTLCRACPANPGRVEEKAPEPSINLAPWPAGGRVSEDDMNVEINEAVARDIGRARMSRGLTIKAAAALIGVSVNNVSIWERGCGLPRYESALRIDEVLGTDIAERYRAHLKGAPKTTEKACSKTPAAVKVEQSAPEGLENDDKKTCSKTIITAALEQNGDEALQTTDQKLAELLRELQLLRAQQNEIIFAIHVLSEGLKDAAVSFFDFVSGNTGITNREQS